MNTEARARLQIRAVLVVYRSETRRLARSRASDATRAAADDLKARSLALIHDAHAKLDGAAAWHDEVRRELDAARTEVAGE